jgi:excisionase family DNA binding protein
MPINTLIIIQICNTIVKYMNIDMIRRARVALGLEPDPIPPTEQVSTLAAMAGSQVSRLLGAEPQESYAVRFEAAPEEPVVLPTAAVRLLAALLTELADRHAVTPTSHPAELSAQEAADLLNVTRPFLMELLDGAQLPYHKVGIRPRVRLSDLMSYKRLQDGQREAALSEIVTVSQDMKLY